MKRLESDFLETVCAAKKTALLKKANKMLATLDSCTKHGGPVTPDSVNLLADLDEKQLLLEVLYLRLTIAHTSDKDELKLMKENGRWKKSQWKN